MEPKPKKRKGFAAMSPEKQREIASKGGKAAHAMGRAHQWNSETAKLAGNRGGNTTKEKYGPEFFSEIGQKGGTAFRNKVRKEKNNG